MGAGCAAAGWPPVRNRLRSPDGRPTPERRARTRARPGRRRRSGSPPGRRPALRSCRGYKRLELGFQPTREDVSGHLVTTVADGDGERGLDRIELERAAVGDVAISEEDMG